jgi:hypothetical protein
VGSFTPLGRCTFPRRTAKPKENDGQRQSALKRICGVSVLIPVFGVLASLTAVMLMALIVSYNWTYVDLTPEFSDEEFVQLRVGPISTMFPAAFNFIRQSPVRIFFPRHTLVLYEHKLPAPCEIISPHMLHELDNMHELDNESQIMDAPWNRSVLHSYVNSPPGISSFKVTLYFDTGCSNLSGDIEGDNTFQEKQQIFLDLVDVFFKNYLWVGHDPVYPIGQ